MTTDKPLVLDIKGESPQADFEKWLGDCYASDVSAEERHQLESAFYTGVASAAVKLQCAMNVGRDQVCQSVVEIAAEIRAHVARWRH